MEIAANLDYTKTAVQEALNILQYAVRSPVDGLTEQQNYLLQTLQEEGLVVVPGFLSQETCAEIRKDIDQLMEQYSERIWRDPFDADNRFFGIEAFSQKINAFSKDPFIKSILGSYVRFPELYNFVMAGRIVPKENNLGSGQGWHRDSANDRQVKAIVYLTDVEKENGPFQYIHKTHKRKNVVEFVAKYGLSFNQKRFPDELARRIADEFPEQLKTYTAKAGTLLLVDTRGIHRGMPIKEGIRYALTQYCFPSQAKIPSHIDSILIKK